MQGVYQDCAPASTTNNLLNVENSCIEVKGLSQVNSSYNDCVIGSILEKVTGTEVATDIIDSLETENSSLGALACCDLSGLAILILSIIALSSALGLLIWYIKKKNTSDPVEPPGSAPTELVLTG
jgi:hypothetical protein